MQSANPPSNPVNGAPRPLGSLSATSSEIIVASHPQQSPRRQPGLNGNDQQISFGKIQQGLQGQVGNETEKIQQLNARIAELEELVEKQRMTISNQSRAIAHPRSARNQQQQQSVGYPVTPHRQAGSGMMTSPSPSVHETPYSVRTQPVGAGLYMQSPPKFDLHGVLNGAQTAKSNHSGSPAGRVQPFGGDKVEFVTAPAAPSVPAIAPAPAPVSMPAIAPASMAVVAVDTPSPHPLPKLPLGPESYFDNEKYTADLVARFHKLWKRTEAFGGKYANTPNPYKDGALDKTVKDLLARVSDKVGPSGFLPDCTARYLLVAKAINFYLVNDLLKVNAAKGFKNSVDAEIGRIKKQLQPGEYSLPACCSVADDVDTPEMIRQLIVIATASQLYQVKKSAKFAEFCKRKVKEHMNQFWQLISPLTSDNSNRVYKELAAILSDAQFLAIDMYSAPFEYKFEFAENDELFDPTTMVNRDPVFTRDPKVLKNSDARVRLGFSPSIHIRSNAAMTTELKLVYMGHVLLRRRTSEFKSARFTEDGLVLS